MTVGTSTPLTLPPPSTASWSLGARRRRLWLFIAALTVAGGVLFWAALASSLIGR